MIRNFLLFLLFLCCFCANAQYTEVINSNHPGFSESPYSVGQKVYQFESNLFTRKAAAIPTFSNPKATGLNLHFRTGLFDEKLEFSLTTALQNNTLAFKNIFESSTTKFSLSQLTLGAKYLVFAPDYKKKAEEIRSWRKRHSFGWDRWIPHIAIYGGANFGLVLNDFHDRGSIIPKFGVLLQNELSNQLNIVTNIYYDYIGGRLPEFSYIVTGTYNFSFKWSGFLEHQALLNKQEKQSNLGIGAAYLLSNDLQLNASAKATFQAENTIGSYVGIGASYRIDRHVDDFIELDEYGNRVDEITKESYNKGFFGRLFDKIKGVFKKKDKREVEIDEEIAKPSTTEDGKQSGRGRTRQKSILGGITKDDEKNKKKTIKEDKKETKQQIKAREKEKRDTEKAEEKEKRDTEKAEEKEKRDIEKAEEKKAKAKAKEQAKLEKEVKKLEEDLAKEEAKAKQEELDRQYEEELAKKKQKEKEEKEKERLEKEKEKEEKEEDEKKDDDDENNDD